MEKGDVHMSLKRLAFRVAAVSLSLAWAVTAQAATYSLTGGGGGWQIGGGLPLPVQAVNFTVGGNPTNTGTNFPPLLIPAKVGAIVVGTTAMAAQQRITVPVNALSRPATKVTVGVFNQNPTLYAVATKLGFQWPATAAVFSTGARTGAKTTTFVTASGNNIRYSNILANKFGGPAQFRVGTGGLPPTGVYPQVGVTIYAVALTGPGNPPCVHTALTPVPFPGPGNPACVAGLAQAVPTASPVLGGSRGVIGGPAGVQMSTPGGTPNAVVPTVNGLGIGPVPGVGIGAFNSNGTPLFFTLTPAGTMDGFTNMATTFGYPWTTGMLTISAPFAAGLPEVFQITGMDNRTAGGAGTIQLVAGGLSQRILSGPNANRGWVRLVLAPVAATPSISPVGLAAAAGLILLAVGYAARRRLTG
jgi:hypothetical protein